MREIKFRVWDVVENSFVPECVRKLCFFLDCQGKPRVPVEGSKFLGRLKEEEYVVQQYINLKDCNGQEIYEGDIILQELNNRKFVVRFGIVQRTVISHFTAGDDSRVDIPCFYFEDMENKLPFFAIAENDYGKHDLETIKVLGNIYENPELL